jgi:glycerophosphoryl diester phosphodiesterase
VLLTSFYDDVTEEVRDSGYPGETGLAQREALRALVMPVWAPPALRPRGNRLQIPCSAGPLSLARPGLIRRMQLLGWAVDYWVVNQAALASELAAMGADGIMTDDPRTVAPALGKG